MNVYACFVNTYRREYFLLADLLPAGLGGHALAVLLQDKDGLLEGRWAGEPLYLVDGSSHDTDLHRLEGGGSLSEFSALDLLQITYLDLTPLLIAHFCAETQVREAFLQAADSNPALLFYLMQIADTLNAQALRQALLERFPGNWSDRYSQLSSLLTGQARRVDSRLGQPPKPETPFQQRKRRNSRERDVELAHHIEIVKIEGLRVTAHLQVCPALRLDGKPIDPQPTGVSYHGRMRFADKLFILRALLSGWSNLPSGIHFTSLPLSVAEARAQHKTPAAPALRKLAKPIFRAPIPFSGALATAEYPVQHRWIGDPYLSSSSTGVQISPQAWERVQAWHDRAREQIAFAQVFLAERWWQLPPQDEIVRWEFTAQAPALVDFLRVGMSWRFFGSATLCPHCGAVESGELVGKRSAYQKTYEDPYEEQGVVFSICDYKCHVCGRAWDEALTRNYRDSSYP